MTTTPPRMFFEQFVQRSYEEFRKSPADEYRAKMAVVAANDMAERMLNYYAGTARVYRYDAKQASLYREELATRECKEFAIIRDVAESHKHFRLTRRKSSRRVSSAEQTGSKPITWTNNKGKELKWTNAAGKAITWRTDVIVEADDGSKHLLLPLVKSVVEMWDRLSVL